MRLRQKNIKPNYPTPNHREICSLRSKHKLTQEEMATIVCVHKNTWAQWERGERSMPSTLWRLACYELGEVNEVKRADVANALQDVSLTDLINEMTVELRNKGQEI